MVMLIYVADLFLFFLEICDVNDDTFDRFHGPIASVDSLPGLKYPFVLT